MGTWRPPCTGTGCGWTTGSTAPTTPRTPSKPAAPSSTGFPSPTPACTGTTRTQTTHTAMGRFGDVFLVNGDPNLKLAARAGEVVRLYLVNTANTRVFNVAIPGARIKLVGGDSGRYEHEQFVDSVVLAPSERVVVDVQFTEPGTLMLEHHTPDRVFPLAEITVSAEHVAPDLTDWFGTLRVNADMVAERGRITPILDSAPDKTVAFVAEMDMDAPSAEPGAVVIYACPMHP